MSGQELMTIVLLVLAVGYLGYRFFGKKKKDSDTCDKCD